MSAAPAEAHDGWTEWGGQPPTHYEFPDRAGEPNIFDGWLLKSASTEMGTSVRWTEIEVYLTVTGKYIIRVLGRSVVYHVCYPEGKEHLGCNTGDRKLGRDMDSDMEPCRNCDPPPDYTDPEYDDTPFKVEVDIPTITSASGARQLIRALRSGNKSGSISYLASKLLRELRAVDPAIAAELSKPVNRN